MDPRITKARISLLLNQPFFGSIALNLRVKEDPTCETFWTDGVYMGYNPDFAKSLTFDELKGVIAHEILHVALHHNTRRQSREPKKWNGAADYAINPIVIDAGMALPKGGLINSAYKNKSAERIYTLLPDQPSGGFGEVRDFEGSPEQIRQHEQDIKIKIAQAAQQAKSMGKLPGGLEKLVESLQPKLPWRDLLRRFIDQSAKDDYSWARFNKRYIGQGVYLPSLYSETMGPIAVFVDTSGSVDEEQLSQFFGEVQGIGSEIRPEKIVVRCCDTHLYKIQEFEPGDPIDVEFKGGGGTDFRPPFKWLAESGINPVCVIYLTDLYGTFPDDQPWPILWITDSDETAPIGETIQW